MNEAVSGYCPMGCGETLFRGVGGFITCTYLKCPSPGAVAEILNDPETEHVISFTEAGFTIKHPLRERLNDALLSCDLHQVVVDLPGPPVKLGVYRASQDSLGVWHFEEQEP